MHPIFISHSSKDKPLVDVFVDTILRLGCNVPAEDIYCSSKEGMKTRPGKEWVQDLKQKMQTAKVVILLLSPNYYESVYCLAELGATWVLDDVQVFPILIPPLTLSEIRGVVQELQAGMIDSDEHLDTLRELVSEIYGTPIKLLPDWTKQRVTFVDQIDTILKILPAATRVSAADLTRAQERAEVYRNERDESLQQIERLKAYVSQLETLKDKQQVAKAKLEHLPEAEQFNELLWSVIQRLRGLPSIVRKALYYHQRREPVLFEDYDEEQQAAACAEKGYLEKRWNGPEQEFFVRKTKGQVPKFL